MSREQVAYTYNQVLVPPENDIPFDRLVSDVSKAGFNVETEYQRRSKLINKFGSDKGNRIWIEGVTDEVVEHAFEYSKKDAVRLPPPYTLLGNNLYSPRFDEFAQSFTSPYEREGSVFYGLQKVEEKLVNSAPDSFVVWTSPSGWTGIENSKYKYSWIHIFWKQEGNVRYASVRNDFNLVEHAGLLNYFLDQDNQLKLADFEKESKEGIKTILTTPVVATKEAGIEKLSDFSDVFSLIRGPSGKMYTDSETDVSYSISDMRTLLDRVSETSQTERNTMQPLINYFEHQLRTANTKQEALKIMAYYVLTANAFWREHASSNNTTDQIISSVMERVGSQVYLSTLLTDLQRVGGCGLDFLKQNTTSFTSRLSEGFTCPNCNKTADGPVGNKCPSCGITKDEWVKKSGEKACD